MELSSNNDGRVFTAAGLSSEDAANRLDWIGLLASDDYNDVNQLVLERIHLDRSVMMALKTLLESDRRSWISLKLVDCYYSMKLLDPQSCEYLEVISSSRDGDPKGVLHDGNFLRFPPRLFLQATTAAPSSRQVTDNNNIPFLPFGCIGIIKSLRICTRCGLTQDMSRRLGDAISKTKTLEEFSLSGSRRLGGRPGSGLSPMLIEGLRRNTSIKALDFGDCQLDNPQVISLLTAIRGHTNLNRLDLSNNKFGDEGLNA